MTTLHYYCYSHSDVHGYGVHRQTPTVESSKVGYCTWFHGQALVIRLQPGGRGSKLACMKCAHLQEAESSSAGLTTRLVNTRTAHWTTPLPGPCAWLTDAPRVCTSVLFISIGYGTWLWFRGQALVIRIQPE